MADRFKKATDEKNYTLIRFDMMQNMKNLNDENIKQTAMELMESFDDEKISKSIGKYGNE